MKKISFLLVALLMTVVTFGQDNAVAKHFSSYQQNKDFTKISVTSKMFSLMTEIDANDPNEKELLDAMAKLKGIKAVVNETSDKSMEMYTAALKTIAKDKSYEELMSLEDKEENLMFLVRDNGGIINELVMIIGAPKMFMVMSLYGEIDLNQIAKLARVMNVKGMEQFKALEKK
jgi:Domain of unknown function (DUF4252)